jgi:hypothetical protein
LETPLGAGAVLTSEWHTVQAGKLVSGRLILDTGVFRKLVPAR